MRFVLDANVSLTWFLAEGEAQTAYSLLVHLAKSLNLPLATFDGGLRAACRGHGVKLLHPPV